MTIDLREHPPGDAEVEVSVFGPGYGECIAVHMGGGEWMVVDSCRRSTSHAPAAIEYLSTLGVDLATQIKMVVATHWHDDHVSGLADLVTVAEAADVFISSAIGTDELLAMSGIPPLVSRFSRGVDELARLQAILAKRPSKPLTTVSANKRIRMVPDAAVSEVWSLSPSAADENRARSHIAQQVAAAQSSEGARRIAAIPPNDASVALYLQTIAGPVLLGADLEAPQDRNRGWLAVVDSASRPMQPAPVFKIPHHGSVTGHSDETWDQMVAVAPVTVVTPFQNGRHSLPSSSDRDRIRTRSSEAYLTSEKNSSPVQRDRSVERTIRDATRDYKVHTLQLGHVQMRSTGSGWTTALSPEAAAV